MFIYGSLKNTVITTKIQEDIQNFCGATSHSHRISNEKGLGDPKVRDGGGHTEEGLAAWAAAVGLIPINKVQESHNFCALLTPYS